MDWYLINQPFYTEGGEIDDFNFNSSLGFNDLLNDTPLSSEVVLCKGRFDGTDFETETIVKGIIQNNDADTVTRSWERQLLVNPNTICDYKYVKYNNHIWLIMVQPSCNKIYEKVVLSLCNWVGKWQDESGVIIYQPFFVQNASQYNSGIKENKVLTIGYNQLFIYTSFDDDSIKIERDKRLFIDYNSENPTVYTILRTDSVSYAFGDNRLITFIATESQYNPEIDNIALMICDYNNTSSSVSQDYTITCVGNPQIRIGGCNKTFTVTSNGENIVWKKVCTREQEDYIILTPNEHDDTKCQVKCLANDLLVGSSFRLKCSSGNLTGSILITIIGGI